jgi:signal transduction histidine kinase
MVDAAAEGWLDRALLLAAAAVLVFRWRAPRVVLACCLGLSLAYSMRTDSGLFAVVPALVALYTVVAAGHRWLGIGVAAPLAAGAVGTALRDGAVAEVALLPAGWLVATVAVGEVVRAAHARVAAAERAGSAAAEHRAAAERLRIARELHDSLTHSISVIRVQAGVAVHLARKRGEEPAEVLLAIEEASGDAARELRETLGALRVADGLARLPVLVARTRGAGLAVTVTTAGSPRPLPSDVDAAAYRIVQEALTNVTRHAATAAATVLISYGAEELVVRVEDEGVGAREFTPGHGIVGMRERVAALGGRLAAAPRSAGGFAVHAALPLVAR